MATECPRCVAERRARRMRAVGNVGVAGASIALATVAHVPLAIVALGLAVAVYALDYPLDPPRSPRPPAPQPGPLATYREGGALECPRHPFAR